MRFKSLDMVMYFSIEGLETLEATSEMEERTAILAVKEVGRTISKYSKKNTSLEGNIPMLIPDDDGNNHSCKLWWFVQSQFKDQVQS